MGANLVFNFVTIVFLLLTVLIGAVVIGVMTDSMDPPILAPEDTLVPPTIANFPPLEAPAGGQLTATPDLALTATPE